MLIFGVIGYVFKKLDYPLAPLVLALVLGDLAENALRQSLIMSQGSLLIFLERPISGAITAVALFFFALPVITPWWRRFRGLPTPAVSPGDLRTASRVVNPFDLGPQFWIRLAEIGFLNLLLSGDNAVLIALAVRALPRHSGSSARSGRRGRGRAAPGLRGHHQLAPRHSLSQIGGRRRAALDRLRPRPPERGRGGGPSRPVALACHLAHPRGRRDDEPGQRACDRGCRPRGHGAGRVGVAMSVPIVIVGSSILAALMSRYPAIIWVGGGILGYVAGDMMLEDPAAERYLGTVVHTLEYPVPLAMAASLTRWAGGSRAVSVGGAPRDGARGSRVLGAARRDHPDRHLACRRQCPRDRVGRPPAAAAAAAPRADLGHGGAVGLRVAFIAVVSLLLASRSSSSPGAWPSSGSR